MPTYSKWPEDYGFGIVGDGPCYVYRVNNRSTAHSAGIIPGDQLLELDGRNVTDMSADAVRTLASYTHKSPSTIGVVSRIQRIELIASRKWGYGLSLTDGNPTRVQSVDPPGPAYQAGIRPGDIVLKINGRPVGNPVKWHSTLTAKVGRITLAMIPIESKDMAVPQVGNNTKTLPSRIRKAKDLFTKMNAVLGSDFEKKMALIGLLKKYAETRDAESFAQSLSVLLTQPQHRAIVQEIRPFIPVKQKLQFDAILSHNPARTITRSDIPPSLSPVASNSSSLTVPWSTQETARELTIHRNDGSFGFVLRGHNPVRVESILPGGPADKARLSIGDAILKVNSVDVSKCSHSHLVQLLQSSGGSPTLEVTPLRMEDILNGQCSSELSGPTSWGWMSDGPTLTMDGTAKTFREMGDHLLTPREKSSLRQALVDYKTNRDITQFVLDASEVLDTPSKRNLWHFLLPRMTQEHQKYVRRHVTVLPPLKEETYLKQSTESQTSSVYENTVSPSVATQHSDSALSYLAAQQGMSDRRHLGSFRQQLGYLLTSRERLLLKKALQIYAERRNVYNLLGDLMEILDTPSKKSLWVYIIPLLSAPHQRYCQIRLGLPEHVIKTDSVKLTRSGAFNIQRWREMDTSRDRPRLYNRPVSLWRKANGMDSSDEDMDSLSPLHQLFKPPGGHSENNRWLSINRDSQPARGSLQDGEQSTITCAPIYAEIDKFNNQRSALKPPHTKIVRDSSAQTTPPPSPPSVRAWSHHTDRCSQTGQRSSIYGNDGHNSDYRESSLASIKENGSSHSSRNSKVIRGHNGMGDYSKASTRNFDSSYEAYQMRAMNAIQALDDAVANEAGSETEQMVAPLAPPAPPPLPPGLPTPVDAAQMKVKRLNWEKIEVVNENSVWAHMGDTDDLEDIVKYLELEQQFSTKRNRVSESFRDRKNEVVIISPKKAYNISILLGHMRMSVADIRQALTQMDETILTPELLKQMLAYAPDSNEMEKYDAFKGSLDELSKPDQFVYQMSRLPGYEQRLKAMLFKANFAEKVEEVKKNLKCIKKASQELQQSSKLTRILELVLAMGNRLNHGNPRVEQATAFRVNYLAMLDLTKTTDGKASFLHILVDTVSSKFADSLRLSEDLPTVFEAARITTSVSNEVIAQELTDLRKVLQEISATVNKLSSSTQRLGDRFHEVMEHFISEASDEIQGLFSLQASTTQEFNAAIHYFGDDPKKVNTCEFFNIFAEFITKFEKANNENMLNKRNHLAVANHKSRATTT